MNRNTRTGSRITVESGTNTSREVDRLRREIDALRSQQIQSASVLPATTDSDEISPFLLIGA
jgi:hypothetical protein